MPAVSPDSVIVPLASVGERLDFARVFEWPEGTTRPVELEVGCGKGRFLVAAAARWPERDFFAVEQVGTLIRKVRDKTVRAGLPNVRIVPGDAKDVLSRLVPDGALARLHVYFPDPWPKRRHAKHRLFAGPIAGHAARVLAPGSQLLLATDHDAYFRECVATFAADERMVRVLTDPFDEIPRGGFDAIFEAANVPVFRAIWERRIAER